MTRSIHDKRNENPAYYDSFSKRIKDALDLYMDKVISEAEYFDKMQTILDDYRANRTTVVFPESIKHDVHAQAFYGVLTAIFDSDETIDLNADEIAGIAKDITAIVAAHSQVDWTNSKSIHDRIAQEIDDLFYSYEKQRGWKVSFDTVDMVIENIKTVALQRF